MTHRALLLAATLCALALPSAAQPGMTASVSDRTAPDAAVRRVSGTDLSATIKKGMLPKAWYSQVLISKHDAFQVMNVGRDKTGQAEMHADYADHVFIQSGEATLVTGGTVADAKEVAPGERRGNAITGGTSQPMRAGDYFFIPATVPHQMQLAPGAKVQYITFKTHK